MSLLEQPSNLQLLAKAVMHYTPSDPPPSRLRDRPAGRWPRHQLAGPLQKTSQDVFNRKFFNFFVAIPKIYVFRDTFALMWNFSWFMLTIYVCLPLFT